MSESMTKGCERTTRNAEEACCRVCNIRLLAYFPFPTYGREMSVKI